MIVDQKKQFEKSEESEVWTAIDAFEQILDAMPEDRTALETLYQAYDHIGDRSRAIEYLVRLANVIHEEGDTAAMPRIYSVLKQEGRLSPSAGAAAEQLETLMVNMGMPSPNEVRSAPGPGAKGSDISQELKLAWNLMQAGELTQDEYSLIARDLTENSTKNVEVPVSVLHAMHDRGFSQLDRVLVHLSRTTGHPILMLSSFEFDNATYSLLPVEYSRHKGAISFQQFGKQCLLAVLNPYDDGLKQDVRSVLNRRCHFYLVSPKEYDAFLERTQQARNAIRVA